MIKRAVVLLLALGCQREPKVQIEPMPPELVRIARVSELDLRWAHDPASGLIAVARETGEPGLVVVDTAHPEQPRAVPTTAPWPHRPVLSAGGRWLAFQDRPPLDDRATLYTFDLANNQQRTVFAPVMIGSALAEEYRGVAAFSPDASALVYEVRVRETEKRTIDELRVLELASGATRVLVKSTEAPVRGATWARDGHIYFTAGASLQRVPERGGAAEVVATVEKATAEGDGDSIAVSDDGAVAAFSLSLEGCIRLVAVRLTGDRSVTRLACGFRPSWRPGSSSELVHIGYPATGSRVPQIAHLDTGAIEALGFDPGVTTEIGAGASGSVFMLTTTPEAPRAIWRIDRGAKPRLVWGPFDDALTRGNAAVEQRRVASSDGAKVPVVVFGPACPAAKATPLILFVHGGTIGRPQRDDTAPRWYREIAFLTHLGATVAAVNVRGSTGYGSEYQEGKLSLVAQVDDLRAALADAIARPGIDRKHVFLFSVSSAAELTAAWIATAPSTFEGVINWVSPPDTLAGGTESLEDLPPMLWLSGDGEPRAPEFARIADRLKRRGLRLTHARVKGDHRLRSADASADALDQVRRFLVERAPLACSK